MERPTVAPRSTRTSVWLLGFLFLCFVYFLPRWHDWNQDARLDMTLAVANHATIAIDAYHWNTKDDDFYRGHYYSNKAPGQSLAGVPIYIAYQGLLRIGPVRSFVSDIERNAAWSVALRDARGRLVPPRLDFALLQYLESVATVGIPAILLLLLFYSFLGLYSESIGHPLFLTLTLGLATMIFPYGQLFYSHVPAAMLLFAAFALLVMPADAAAADQSWIRYISAHGSARAFLAGLALGGAVLFEYPTALPALLLGLLGLARLPRRQWPYLVAGVLPPALVVMGYGFIAYHNPLATGYSGHEVLWKQEAQGVGGFTWPPRSVAIVGMSVSRYRGLFFLSPVLLLAVPGFALWLRDARGRDRASWACCMAVPIVFFFAIAMYWGWYAGQVVGPRYLIPILPFLAFPIIFVLKQLRSGLQRSAAYILLAASVFNIWSETLGGQGYPHGYTANPLFTYSLPALAHGNLPLNLGSFIGLDGFASLVPLALLLLVWSVIMLARFRGYRLVPA